MVKKKKKEIGPSSWNDPKEENQSNVDSIDLLQR